MKLMISACVPISAAASGLHLPGQTGGKGPGLSERFTRVFISALCFPLNPQGLRQCT